jgi:hypothetical protein
VDAIQSWFPSQHKLQSGNIALLLQPLAESLRVSE